MDKKYLNILKSRGTMLSAALCVLAVGATVGVTSMRKTNDNNISLEGETAEPYVKYEAVEPVIVTKNAEKRDEVLEIAEDYTEYTPVAKAEENDEFVLNWPVAGEIVMDFSTDRLIYDSTLDQYRTNDCVAIAAESGEKITAAASGVVAEVGESREDGWYVVVDHENGWQTTYGQMQENLAVNVGDKVSDGSVIGYVGEPTLYGAMLGEHVEFKVTLNDYAVDPKTAVGENTGE